MTKFSIIFITWWKLANVQTSWYLSWWSSFNGHHCIKLGKKLTKSLYFPRRVQNILTKEALLSLNYAIFHAHLLYCPIVTSGISAQVLKKIKILQKKAIRTITKSKSREHTEPLFRQLRILPYDKIVQMSKLNFMHAVRYRYSPHTFQSYWQINENRNME